MTNPKNDLKSRLASVLGRPPEAAPEAAAPVQSAPPEAPTHRQAAAPQQPAASAATGPPDEAIDGMLDRLNNLSSGNPNLQETAANAPSQNPTARQAPRRRRRPGSAAAAAPPAPQADPGAPASAAPEAPPAAPPAVARKSEPAADEDFLPREPNSIQNSKLNDSLIAELALKYINAKGEASGQDVAEHICMPFTTLIDLFSQMKFDQLIYYKDTTSLNDYVMGLTDLGRDRARVASNKCTYYGAAPVPLKDYIAAVSAQSIAHQTPGRDDLDRAFSDLLINKGMFLRLGAAMNSGRGMFLFGFPGNGKTSIAERVTKAFGEFVWIPRAIIIEGELVRVYDPAQHEPAPLDDDGGLLSDLKIDERWVRIRRPTIIAGGELTMDNLEMSFNPATGINEAPLQMKSNMGTLVIDDFGRQRMTTDELLNRWIVPLEKRYDFLNLPSGKKIQIPFDQLVIFSTNLEPKDLVDDAFLRRIPYKIEVKDPTENEFRELFKFMCPLMKFEYEQGPIDHLIENHYKSVNRPYRCCQPRDLLLQIKNYCLYERKPVVLSNENFDFAASNYFAVM